MYWYTTRKMRATIPPKARLYWYTAKMIRAKIRRRAKMMRATIWGRSIRGKAIRRLAKMMRAKVWRRAKMMRATIRRRAIRRAKVRARAEMYWHTAKMIRLLKKGRSKCQWKRMWILIRCLVKLVLITRARGWGGL
jgi:hypothetical protein